MSNQNTNAADDILDVIEMGIKNYISRLKDNFVRTTVKAVSSDFNYYTVLINGADYKVISGCGIRFDPGDQVWVHIPEGDYKKAYISASAQPKYIS